MPWGAILAFLVWAASGAIHTVAALYVIKPFFPRDNKEGLFGGLPISNNGLFLLGSMDMIGGLGLIAHAAAVFLDPGSTRHAPRRPPRIVESPVFCALCDNRWKPPRAHHCRSCKECIFRMDHHCPWINNCVAFRNQKPFILFLIYIGIGLLLNLFILSAGLFYWMTTPDTKFRSTTAGILSTDFSLTVFFLNISLGFLFEQYEALQSNSTLVESYQLTRGRQNGFFRNFKDSFGENAWLWLVPVPAKIHMEWAERVFPLGTSQSFGTRQRHRERATSKI